MSTALTVAAPVGALVFFVLGILWARRHSHTRSRRFVIHVERESKSDEDAAT